MANGNGDPVLAALPTWLRAVLSILLQQGVAVAIAVFLVWWISGRVLVNQETILQEIRSHRQDSAIAGRAMTEFADRQEDTQRSLVLLQLQTCLNVARDVQSRQECVRASR